MHTAVLPNAPSLLGMMPVQWQRVLGGGEAAPAFLSELAPRVVITSAAPVAVAAVSSGVSLETVLDVVKRTAGSAVDADAPLMEAGVDSLGAVELRNQLQRAVGKAMTLSSTLMFDHPTARQVAVHLQGSQPVAAVDGASTAAPVAGSSPVEVAGVSFAVPHGVTTIKVLRQTLSLIHI